MTPVYLQSWRDRNKDKLYDILKKSYDKNKDKILKRKKEYRKENKEKIKKQRQDYWLRKKEKLIRELFERVRVRYFDGDGLTDPPKPKRKYNRPVGYFQTPERKEWMKNWYQRNKGRIKKKNAKRAKQKKRLNQHL